jgi:hypothetical protein
MYGSGDVARGEYDNTEVEAIRGNFARKSHNKKLQNNSTLMTLTTVSDFANNEHDNQSNSTT